MNIPNCLTIFRIVLTLFCVICINQNTLPSLVLGFILFIIASISDFLDGYIARKRNIISDLGKLLDPIADKVLIAGILLSFLELGVINIWVVIIILTREFIITGVRLFALSKGYVLSARNFGKHKTFSQMFAINYIFIMVILYRIIPVSVKIQFFYYQGITLLMWYVAAITLASGLHYLWTNRSLIKNF